MRAAPLNDLQLSDRCRAPLALAERLSHLLQGLTHLLKRLAYLLERLVHLLERLALYEGRHFEGTASFKEAVPNGWRSRKTGILLFL